MFKQSEPQIPLDTPWYRAPFFAGLILIVLPPLGLWLTWRDQLETRFRKILFTILGLVWLVPYTIALGAMGLWMGWYELEFQGGWGPVVVGRRTVPNFGVLDEHRQDQAALAAGGGPTNVLAGLKPYWTDFRGPARDGLYNERPVLTEWPLDGIPRLWRQPCGGGYASFVVAEGRAITIEQRWDREVIVAYEIDTGREVWNRSYEARFQEWMGGEGPRATPTYFDTFVYSLGATGELRALSAASGSPLWEQNILKDTGAENLKWGLAASPIVVDRALIVLNGNGAANQSVVAYDSLSGRRLWSALSDRMTYASPIRATLAGRDQIVFHTATRVVGFDTATREVLWEVPWEVQYEAACAVPILAGADRVFVSSGYGAGAAMIQVQRVGQAFSATPLWQNRSMRNKFNASVLWKDHLYGLDEGVLACVNAATGDQVWRDGRYGYGQVLLADDHLFIVSGDGILAVVEATPAGFREKHRTRALTGKTWNVPAFAYGRLLIRNGSEMTCFDLRRRRSDTLVP